jgi:hypothetical protein
MAVKDIVYIQKVEGREKPNFIKCGVLLEKDNGKLSIHLDTIPAAGWNGWLSVMEQREKKTEKDEPPF